MLWSLSARYQRAEASVEEAADGSDATKAAIRHGRTTMFSQNGLVPPTRPGSSQMQINTGSGGSSVSWAAAEGEEEVRAGQERKVSIGHE